MAVSGRDKIVTKSFNFICQLLVECYQFLFNLPLLLASLFAGVAYEPVSAPKLDNLFSSIFVKTINVMDIIMEQVVNLLEYHLVLTPAAIICLCFGKLDKWSVIQERMHTFFDSEEIDLGEEDEEIDDEAEVIVQEIVDEIIEEVVDTEDVIKSSTMNFTPVKDLNKSIYYPTNESGYLSEPEITI